MADVTGEEFRTFMKILSSLKVMANAHQELAGIVAEQVELTQAFQVPFLHLLFWKQSALHETAVGLTK